jgi:hypothetical protein
MPDPRLETLASIVSPEKVVPTTMEFVDIAGLVAGASKGEGLGNQFLANIRETDAVAHVVRCFEDENVTHVSNKVNPEEDIGVINTELQLADLQSLESGISRISRLAKSGDKEEIARVEYLESLKAHIDKGQPARAFITSDDHQKTLQGLHLLTMKPVLYIANVDEEGFEDNPHLDVVRRIAKAENAELVVICNKLEEEIALLDHEERTDFLRDLGMDAPGLDRVIRAGYRLLNLQTYFTAGPKETRAWTVRKGVSAPRAAGVIHTDFEKGFIKAEVIGYEDYVKYDGESGAKSAGRLRIEGKEYIVQDGDVVHFRFNV